MPGDEAQAGAATDATFWRRMAARSPLELLLVTPLVTLPLSALLVFTVGGEIDAAALGLVEVEWTRDDGRLDRKHYFYFDFWLTWVLLTAPGIVNLVVVWWLRHELVYVRGAAVMALALALLRTFVVPVAAMVWLTAEVIDEGGLLLLIPIGEAGDPSGPSPLFATLSLLTTAWTGGLGMWLVTLGVWQAYEPLMARFLPNVPPPRDRFPDEPRRWTGFARRR